MRNNARGNLKDLVAKIVGVVPDALGLAVKAITAEQYSRRVTAAVERMYYGITRGGVPVWRAKQLFRDEMKRVTKAGLKDAFIQGADDIGIAEDELINADWADLDKIITEEQSHIDGFADYIGEQAKREGSTIDSVTVRADLWANRWTDVRTRAKLILGKDGKLEWVYGDTEHCDTCLALNGRVKRASYWAAHVQPRNPPNSKIDCKGYQCQCTLEPTEKPISKGRLPFGL
jgi:hypothetical protein